MRKKWRSDKQLFFSGCQTAQIMNCKLLVVFCLLIFCVLITDCSNRTEQEHMESSRVADIDGLAQPSNQTVFSDVKTVSPIIKTVSPIINATGVITYDMRLLNTISAKFNGRIEKLYVRFNFQNISKGQRIMDIYSPEILTEQKNLIFLSSSSSDIELLNSSKQKLHLLGLTKEQIEQILSSHHPINPLPIYSLYNGHIHDIGISNEGAASSSMGGGMNTTVSSSAKLQIENLPTSQTSELSIKEGMYFQTGQSVFAVYNMDQVCAVLNIFPRDAAMVNLGDKVLITSEISPQQTIESTIDYIDPVAGKNASAIKARVYLQHANNLHLEIGTLLSAKIPVSQIKGLWLPRNAIVNLGQRQVVFLKSNNHFITKSIRTGMITDSLIQIISGLRGDEMVAVNGQYMIDSESFILTTDDEK